MPPPAHQISSPATDFAVGLAQKTGLSLRVVYAWMRAEGAYAKDGTGHFNFLNVRPSSNAGVPEGRSTGGFATFRNADEAVAATVNVLRQPNMAPIIRAAKSNDQAQLAAIARSPWDANHYKGGSLLRGAYKTTGSVAAATQPATGLGPVGSIVPSLPDVGGYITQATSWAEGAALRALAYLVLTIAAVALFVLGLEKMLGPTPLTRAMPYNPRTAPIPY